METKTIEVVFVRTNSCKTLKCVASDEKSVSVPVAVRKAHKHNDFATLEVRESKDGKYYVAVGLNAPKKRSANKAFAIARALFEAARAAKQEQPTTGSTTKATKGKK